MLVGMFAAAGFTTLVFLAYWTGFAFLKDDELTLPPVARFNLWTIFDAHKTKEGHDFTLEEAIVEVLSEHGPVVALNEPGPPLPPLGAERANRSGDHWQEVIDRCIAEVGWIVAIVATSPGLLWEFERIIERGAAGRLLLVFPPVDEAQLSARWQVAYPLFTASASEADLNPAPVARTLVLRADENPPSLKPYASYQRTQNSLDTAMRIAVAGLR